MLVEEREFFARRERELLVENERLRRAALAAGASPEALATSGAEVNQGTTTSGGTSQRGGGAPAAETESSAVSEEAELLRSALARAETELASRVAEVERLTARVNDLGTLNADLPAAPSVLIFVPAYPLPIFGRDVCHFVCFVRSVFATQKRAPRIGVFSHTSTRFAATSSRMWRRF